MPRFVVLEHDHPVLHWDLMLEADAVLQTWRLAQPPALATSAIAATALPDHRVIYLDYEGPVSGERGTVQRWDVGEYTEEPESQADARRYWFQGTRVRGRVRLDQCTGADWLFRDEFIVELPSADLG